MDRNGGIGNSATRRRFALAVFASRESPDVLVSTLRSALAATDSDTVVEVLVNGNQVLAEAIGRWKISDCGVSDFERVRIWSIKIGDKANAWNQYFHTIWSGEELVFFTDGYVGLRGDSIALLRDAVLSNPNILGGSGVPSSGWSADRVAKTLLAAGGFHGNFCCVRNTSIVEIRQRNFRIPLGLYRTDSLIGAILSYGFDPKNNSWDRQRIYVHPKATWSTPAKHWWLYSEWIAYAKRRLRQAKGILENAAVKDHLAVHRKPPEMLPVTAAELVADWMRRCPTAAKTLIRRHPTIRLILQTYVQSASCADCDLVPERLESVKLSDV